MSEQPVHPDERSPSLDPADWTAFRMQAHRMLDDILSYIEDIRERPVWQPVPESVRERLSGELPAGPSDLAVVHEEFSRLILPYTVGNVHPRFMGWVHGAGTPAGVLAEMLAAGLDANLGGRDHAPVEVEKQVVAWMRALFRFPEGATGLFVTGTSMANLVAVLVARDAELGFGTRREGVAACGKRLTAYASAAVHECVGKALDIAGIGSDALRRIAVDGRYRIDLDALSSAIEEDRRAGFTPFLLVGTAGTVDTGAIDDLSALADVSSANRLWFHVDGACGALAMLAPQLAPRLAGIERADSLAFDFHKWGQAPYDAGFVLVRDGMLHRRTFATTAPYLRREARGLAGGDWWPCDYGPDLSRAFRALKVWFTLKTHGAGAIGASIVRTCELADYLAHRIMTTPELELAAPVELNIVCFRYVTQESDRVNARIAIELQESGVAAPSTTILEGRLAIRAAIVNHRTAKMDIDLLLEKVVEQGRRLDVLAAGSVRKEGTAQPSREAREAALQQIETKFAEQPEVDALRIERARLLDSMGRTAESKEAYLGVLLRDPSHLAALNEFGRLLHATGYRTAARTAFTEAVAQHPEDAASHLNLASALWENGELGPAQEHYQAVLRLDPDCAEAHRGLSHVLADLGDEEGAARHRRIGFAGGVLQTFPYRGEGSPVSVLMLVSSAGGNVRMMNFLDSRWFETTLLEPEFFDTGQTLPRHDVVINAIGDADLAGTALAAAESVLALSRAPVVNAPAAVMATGRADNAERLAKIPGVVVPAMVTLPRNVFGEPEAAARLARHGLDFPLLVRTPGFHTGQHFERVERPEDLAGAVALLPGPVLTAISFLDSRQPDGKVRKYRVMAIGGDLYPLHAAISSHWKIHYFTAEMADSAEHRAEDAEFLSNMPDVLGKRGIAALHGIGQALGLDYAGIDFGLSAAGEILLYEANATMVVNPTDADGRWDYRRPAVRRIYEAIQRMLLARAQR